MMTKITVAAGLMLGLGLNPVMSEETQSASVVEDEKAIAELLEDYTLTGDRKRCLTARLIKQSKAISDHSIVFTERGRKKYLNRLKSRCPQLGHYNRFSYSMVTTNLCSGRMINIFGAVGMVWSTCSIGEFEELEEKQD